jgi:hypothetical protein
MKLLSLNLWAGRVYDKLVPFLKEKAPDIDVFCFQEVLSEAGDANPQFKKLKKAHSGSSYDDVPDLYSKLKSVLTDFDSILGNPLTTTEDGERLAIFYRRGMQINDNGFVLTSKPVKVDFEGESFTLSSAIQYIMVDKDLCIGNIHGLWQQVGKRDTPERLYQSEKIVEFLSRTSERRVLVGDFNLSPETKSIEMIEDSGMLNLIKRNNVQSTRSSLYPRLSKGKFADYAFVSNDINVNEFRVLQDEVSDHLPLYLNFS